MFNLENGFFYLEKLKYIEKSIKFKISENKDIVYSTFTSNI